MTTITIFGNGNLGQALDVALSKSGATIQHIVSSHKNATVEGGLVILAVPYSALATIAKDFGEQLADKVVVDVTNPIDFQTFGTSLPEGVASAAEELQAQLPNTVVLKAFNTNFGASLQAGTVGGLPIKVLVAGDDAEAKRSLIETVNQSGLRGVDAGGLNRAHALEQIGDQQIFLAVNEKTAWNTGFVLAD